MAFADIDPYQRACPSRRLLDRIGDRWTVLVIAALETAPEQTMRFSAMRRRIDGVSQKMLTQTLRALERDGLVTRTAHAEVPPRVEYALTDLGRSLTLPLGQLLDWATENLVAVEDAQHEYDEVASA